MFKQCKQCQNQFETETNQRIYCSEKCRRDFHNLKLKTAVDLVLNCQQCGCEFKANAFSAKRQKFCSKNCRNNFSYRKLNGQTYLSHKKRKQQESVDLPDGTCLFCNTIFKCEYIQAINKKYCSQKCKADHHALSQRQESIKLRQNTIRICPICTKSFSPQKTLKEIYCSKRCRSAVGKRVYKMMQSCYEKTSTPKSDHAHKVLGYSPAQLLEHLQKFPDWEQLKRRSWHLDHIFPIIAFVRNGIKDISLICALDNLQPLAGPNNCSKGDTYDEDSFKTWLESKVTKAST